MVRAAKSRDWQGPALIVHGGAGDLVPDREAFARRGCRAACRIGLELLAGGGTALDAAQAAVRVLEDDPTFNAGIGAVLARHGGVEVDAAVMDGAHLRFGAVAAMPNARQPIDIARAVLDDGEHVLLAGRGAWDFARERGFAPCEPDVIITDRARERWREARDRAHGERAAGSTAAADVGRDSGTVGACAVDRHGHVAAATSTGGTNYKRGGRIGDTPLCGCGTYADDEGGAASGTGHGESLIRATTALRCVDALRQGASATAAAWHAIDDLAQRVDGRGGIICVDRFGDLGAAHNSTSLSYAAGRVLAAGEIRWIFGDIRAPRELDLHARWHDVRPRARRT
jgi:beta-aspartyl-peptidase (threonine type)